MIKCLICKSSSGTFQTPSTPYIKMCFYIMHEPINVCQTCLTNMDKEDYVYGWICKNVSGKNPNINSDSSSGSISYSPPESNPAGGLHRPEANTITSGLNSPLALKPSNSVSGVEPNSTPDNGTKPKDTNSRLSQKENVRRSLIHGK